MGISRGTQSTITSMRGAMSGIAADLIGSSWRRSWLHILLSVGMVGCASSPPRFVKPASPDPMLTKDGGPMLVSDACLQRRVLVGANHFVIGEGERAATELDRQLRGLLANYGLAIAGPPLTSVCGVTFDAATPLKTYSQVMDGDVLQGEQPLQRSNALAKMAPDSKALGLLLAELQAIALSRPGGPDSEGWREDLPVEPLSESSRTALEALQRASGRSQMLFIGVGGNSESGGKTALFVAGVTLVGVAAAVAMAPAAVGAMSVAQTVSAQAVVAASAPFMPVSGWRTVGAWVDATRGEVRWTGWTSGRREPLTPIWFASSLPLATSIFDPLILRKDDQWSLPGMKVRP